VYQKLGESIAAQHTTTSKSPARRDTHQPIRRPSLRSFRSCQRARNGHGTVHVERQQPSTRFAERAQVGNIPSPLPTCVTLSPTSKFRCGCSRSPPHSTDRDIARGLALANGTHQHIRGLNGCTPAEKRVALSIARVYAFKTVGNTAKSMTWRLQRPETPGAL
jgi:hypothetical protein